MISSALESLLKNVNVTRMSKESLDLDANADEINCDFDAAKSNLALAERSSFRPLVIFELPLTNSMCAFIKYLAFLISLLARFNMEKY